MNLRQCEIFRAVMEAGTVTTASERLRISQPAVSKMLAQFERELGFRVFLRQNRRLTPTPEAHALYREIRRAFVGLDYLTRFAGDLRELRQGHLVLAATHAICTFYLPSVIARFLHSHPGLSISLHTADSPGIAEAVATQRADLGIAQFRVPTQGVDYERLCSVETVCVMPPNHALARRRVIRPADLHGQTFIALASVNRLRIRLAAVLEAEGVVPRTQVDTPLASTACNLVMAGVGICVLDRLSAEASGTCNLAIRPFRAGITEDLLMLSSEQAPLSGVANAFAALLRQSFGREAADRPRDFTRMVKKPARTRGSLTD